MKLKAFWLAGLLLASALLGTEALEVSQIEFDLHVPAGASATYTFTVHNDELLVDDVKVYLADWDRDPQGNHRFYEPGTLPRSNTAWIEISPTSFTLQPDEAKEVRFTITVPADAEGTYWGMIMVEGRPRPEEHGGATVLAVPRFGIKIYETPPGTGQLEGRVLGLRRRGLNPPWFLVNYQNSGSIHQLVRGELQVTDVRGETVLALEIPEFPVLPGARREVVAAAAPGTRLAPGRYQALAILDFGSPDYLAAGQAIFDVPELHLVPLPGTEAPPQDLDSDGFYEDVNGDGCLDNLDPELLEENLGSAAVQNNWPAFDYDNDGDADLDDVARLRGLVAQRG